MWFYMIPSNQVSCWQTPERQASGYKPPLPNHVPITPQWRTSPVTRMLSQQMANPVPMTLNGIPDRQHARCRSAPQTQFGERFGNVNMRPQSTPSKSSKMHEKYIHFLIS